MGASKDRALTKSVSQPLPGISTSKSETATTSQFGKHSTTTFEPFRLDRKPLKETASATSGISLPPILNRNGTANKLGPAIVKHGHNDFLSKYNLTSPREELDNVSILEKPSKSILQAPPKDISKLSRQLSRTDILRKDMPATLPPLARQLSSRGAHRIRSPKNTRNTKTMPPKSPL